MEKLLTVEEIAAMLQVPKTWIYRKTFERKIPFVKIGKYLRFRESEIITYIADCKK